MEIICHLLFRCVRIGDVLRTLCINDVCGRKSALKNKIHFNEEKTGKLQIIGIRGMGFTRALQTYWSTVTRLPRTGSLFYTRKTGRLLGDSGVKRLLLRFVGKRGIMQGSPHSFRTALGTCMNPVSGTRTSAMCSTTTRPESRRFISASRRPTSRHRCAV
jgi:hypothetical protein